MINYLTIYKFSFPFIEEKYEEVLFNSIISDIKEVLIYEEVKFDIITKDTKKLKILTIKYKGGKIELIFNKTDDFFIPKFQLNYFYDDIGANILIKFINIFETLGVDNYVFDYGKKLDNLLGPFNLKNIKVLEKNFKKYSEEKLYKFLKNSHKYYIKDELKSNKIILDSFLYMIYMGFIFSKNKNEVKNIKNEIKSIKDATNNIDYLSYISLNESRLNHINEINISTSNKYRNMLSVLFNLFK